MHEPEYMDPQPSDELAELRAEVERLTLVCTGLREQRDVWFTRCEAHRQAAEAAEAEIKRLRELNECHVVNARGAQETIAELLDRIGATHLDEACEKLTRLRAVVAAADALRKALDHVGHGTEAHGRWISKIPGGREGARAVWTALDAYDAARGAR